MNLIDALKTIEAHMRQGMTIECWMLSNGALMRKVAFNDGESLVRTLRTACTARADCVPEMLADVLGG